jgi:uncharacterized protein YkwD
MMKLMGSCRKHTILSLFALFLAIPSLHAGSLEEAILRYTNEYRRSQGKPPLQRDAAAAEQAEKHSSNMARGKTGFGHSGFKERVNAVSGASGRVSAAAENVAYGQQDAESVVKGWIRSKQHRKNMLGNYNKIGIGVAKSRDGTLYFTQLFLKQ